MYIYLSVLVFIIAYALIIWDRYDRSAVALTGALLMVLLGVISQEKAFEYIDFNTIGLLIGMMLIVNIIKRTGVFEYIAIKLVKLAGAEPLRIIFFISLATGILSAFLDNVTTIVLILPVTLSIARDMKLNPIPFIISEVFASNVGGASTLIGDPPNIIIGSSTGLGFIDFITNVGGLMLVLLILSSLIFKWIYKKRLIAKPEVKAAVLQMSDKGLIKDKKLLIKGLSVLFAVILCFLTESLFHYESATIALAGAALLLIISGVNVEKTVHEVEWRTIMFFAGLFIMVGGVNHTGVINILAERLLHITNGNLALTSLSILWSSALLSAFLDNIPFVTTMVPLIKHMGELSGLNLIPIWWALSIGACLGGNGTIIGASANIIAVGMAEDFGCKITFKNYFKVAFPVMLLTVIISTVYIYFAYLS